MPLVAHNKLPTFARLSASGFKVLTPAEARQSRSRELHFGLLNMMPDAALTATEVQFMRLLGTSELDATFYVYPFSIPELNRSAQTEKHIAEHYFDFAELKERGVDALIITGANVANPSLDREAFWDPLIRVVRWADDNVASILCSCLATHALLKHRHGIERRRLPQKQWGVYNHETSLGEHPLMAGIDGSFPAPHSRYNEVTRAQLEDAGLPILAESPEAGVHLAVSPDAFHIIYFQGHPEYQANSLLKEYKREVFRYLAGERASRPRVPDHYFPETAITIATDYVKAAEKARSSRRVLPEFPEVELEQQVINSWRETGMAIVNNWLGLVYEIAAANHRSQSLPGG